MESPQTKLSVVVPCYNEEATLEACIERLLQIEDEAIALEVLIVDDGSRDKSKEIAGELSNRYSQVKVIACDRNRGKGAALRTGFAMAEGDIVAVQDADLEYSPADLKKLLAPIMRGDADVVFGSRFLSGSERRVLYFWHRLANGLLTFISNMFTDLDLTDMETCYKVFRRDVIQGIELAEDRFGIEPELVAKTAQFGARIFEMGVTYHGRTYKEGKKIGFKDALRALYCIFHYNAPTAPMPMQFAIYFFIGGSSAVFNLFAFLGLYSLTGSVGLAAPGAFFSASALNYALCIAILFRHRARWCGSMELAVYGVTVGLLACVDWAITVQLLVGGMGPVGAKAIASFGGLILNFMARRYLVFPLSVDHGRGL